MTEEQVCPQEPEKKYEETVCGMAEKVSNTICEQIDNGDGKIKQVCKVIIHKVGTGQLDGKIARQQLISMVGQEKFEQAAKKAIEVLDSS